MGFLRAWRAALAITGADHPFRLLDQIHDPAGLQRLHPGRELAFETQERCPGRAGVDNDAGLSGLAEQRLHVQLAAFAAARQRDAERRALIGQGEAHVLPRQLPRPAEGSLCQGGERLLGQQDADLPARLPGVEGGQQPADERAGQRITKNQQQVHGTSPLAHGASPGCGRLSPDRTGLVKAEETGKRGGGASAPAVRRRLATQPPPSAATHGRGR
jgi:hypothetical protein